MQAAMKITMERENPSCCSPACRVEAILTVDERGQMVLPKDIRERAGIQPGGKLALIRLGEGRRGLLHLAHQYRAAHGCGAGSTLTDDEGHDGGDTLKVQGKVSKNGMLPGDRSWFS